MIFKVFHLILPQLKVITFDVFVIEKMATNFYELVTSLKY